MCRHYQCCRIFTPRCSRSRVRRNVSSVFRWLWPRVQFWMMQVRISWAFEDLGKNAFLACFKAFLHIFLSRFILMITLSKISGLVIQLHTYCGLCILGQKCKCSVCLVKITIFDATQGICKRINICFCYFWIHHWFRSLLIQTRTCWEMRISGQKTVIFWFFWYEKCFLFFFFFFFFFVLILILDGAHV